MVSQGALSELITYMFTKKMKHNVDLSIDLTLGGTKLGTLHVTGTVEHIPEPAK